jgi:hypothetical protein
MPNPEEIQLALPEELPLAQLVKKLLAFGFRTVFTPTHHSSLL